MQFLVSTRFGAAMSCAPRARDDLLLTRGSRMSRCPRLTPCRRRRGCGRRAAFHGKNVDRPGGGRVSAPGGPSGPQPEFAMRPRRSKEHAVTIFKACRSVWKPCGTWRWKCWARAIRLPMRALSRPLQDGRPNPRSRTQSVSVLRNCWAARDINFGFRRPARGGRCMATGSGRSDGLGARPGRGGDRPL